LLEFREEPRIDLREFVHALNAPTHL
jgi:hypothetical protein